MSQQIVQYKDQIGQQYLMEIVIQVFPDEFHLATLDGLLETIGSLQSGVDLKSITISLMDRLSNFASENQTSDLDIFGKFSVFVNRLIEVCFLLFLFFTFDIFPNLC